MVSACVLHDDILRSKSAKLTQSDRVHPDGVRPGHRDVLLPLLTSVRSDIRLQGSPNAARNLGEKQPALGEMVALRVILVMLKSKYLP
jgi:hypothetical protein